MSDNSNNVIPNFNAYSETINSIIKSSIPVIDTSVYMEPLVNSAKASLSLLNESINLSFQPLIDYINEINKEIESSINVTISNMISDSFQNLKTITSYSAETIESISKFALVETIDDVCDSLDKFEFNNEIVSLTNEYKNEIISVKNDLSNSNSKEIDIHQWIATISAIITLILAILPIFDNPDKDLIDQQQQIIEYQSKQLEKLKSIDESLKKLTQFDD